MHYLFLLCVLSYYSWANDPTLKEAQDFLKDPKARESYIKKNKEAQLADEKVKSIAGNPENMEVIYGLASEIMGNLVEESGGDPKQMESILIKGQENPESFLKGLSPEQRKKVKGLAEKIEREQKATP